MTSSNTHMQPTTKSLPPLSRSKFQLYGWNHYDVAAVHGVIATLEHQRIKQSFLANRPQNTRAKGNTSAWLDRLRPELPTRECNWSLTCFQLKRR